MTIRTIVAAAVTFSFVPAMAKAHCPLCTAGAGALAILAASFGVSTMAIGVFMGAFAVALGLWMAKLVAKKKTFFAHQSAVIAIITFFLTIIPMMPLVSEYMSINIYWFGSYGNPFNRTYMVHNFLTGSLIGAVIMLVSPYISAWIKKLRDGKLIPYQGILITLLLLTLTSLSIQFGL